MSFSFYSGLFADYGLAFKPDIEAFTADQILPIVDYGLGVGLVPDVFLKKASAKYRRLKTDTPLPCRSIYLVRRAKQPVSAATKSFIGLLVRLAAEKNKQ